MLCNILINYQSECLSSEDEISSTRDLTTVAGKSLFDNLQHDKERANKITETEKMSSDKTAKICLKEKTVAGKALCGHGDVIFSDMYFKKTPFYDF